MELITVDARKEARVLATLYSGKKKNGVKRLLLRKLKAELFSNEERRYFFNEAKKRILNDQSVSLVTVRDSHVFEARFKPYAKVLKRTVVLKKAEHVEMVEILNQCRKNRALERVQSYIATLEDKEAIDYSEVTSDLSEILKSGAETGLTFSVAGAYDPEDDRTNVVDGRVGIKQLKEIDENSKPVVPSYFENFNKVNGGYFLGSLVLLVADRGGGKSMLGKLDAVSCYKTYGDSAFFSVEMNERECWARIISHEAEVDSKKILLGTLSDREKRRVTKAEKKFWNIGKKTGRRFSIIASGRDEEGESYNQYLGNTPVSEICRELNGDYNLRVWDYISLFADEPAVKQGREDQKLGEIAKVLKRDATTHDIVNILICQFDTQEQKVKYSKYVEYHADLIISWDVEEMTEGHEDEILKLCHFRTLKHRKQSGMEWSAYMEGKYTKFVLNEQNIKMSSKKGKKTSKVKNSTKMEGFNKKKSWKQKARNSKY